MKLYLIIHTSPLLLLKYGRQVGDLSNSECKPSLMAVYNTRDVTKALPTWRNKMDDRSCFNGEEGQMEKIMGR